MEESLDLRRKTGTAAAESFERPGDYFTPVRAIRAAARGPVEEEALARTGDSSAVYQSTVILTQATCAL